MFKEIALSFSAAIFFWESYLSLRQRRKLSEKKVPKTLDKILSESDFRKANEYGLDKSTFGFFSSLFSESKSAFIVIYNVLPFLWHVSGQWLTMMYTTSSNNEIMHSLVFLWLFMTISTIIDLPFSLYSTFVIEQKHGFNKQTIRLYFSDLIKQMLLGTAIGLPVVSGFLYLIINTGERFFLYVWMFMLAFQLLMLTIFPTWIQPLFNKFTALEEGPLKVKIDKLAKSIHFPLTEVFMIDGSKRSSHSNAYFTGIFKKRIVLFDTLIKDSSEDEICGILAHELGHWKLNHIIKTLLVSQIHLFLIFYSFSFVVSSKELYAAFGFNDEMPVLIGFLLFNFFYSPVEAVFSFLMNMLSRLHEFQADAFAKSLGYAEVLKSGLIKIHVKNRGNMNPDPWYSTYHFSHPPLIERLKAIQA